MPLDRQNIEKKDFPVGRRGYDPEAVDAHLAALAVEVDELKRTSRRKHETLASSASEQVRAIVEAAETSAADIQRQADDEARDIRAEASTEAQNTREQAAEQAREYVGKVSETTASMLQRLDAMESELNALIESLRTGSNRLNADLQLLEVDLTAVGGAVSPRPSFEPEEVEEPEQAAQEPAGESTPTAVQESPQQFGEPPQQPASEPASVGSMTSSPGDGSDDTEAARLIALNMALNGTPREETDRYLEENFQLGDRGTLLDEVYASVDG